MRYGRERGHGVAFLGNKIYVVGGIQSIRKCERFDLQKEVWTELPDFDEYGSGVTLMGIKSRYVVGVGGRNDNFEYPDAQRFTQLDSLKLNKGWKILHLNV